MSCEGLPGADKKKGASLTWNDKLQWQIVGSACLRSVVIDIHEQRAALKAQWREKTLSCSHVIYCSHHEQTLSCSQIIRRWTRQDMSMSVSMDKAFVHFNSWTCPSSWASPGCTPGLHSNQLQGLCYTDCVNVLSCNRGCLAYPWPVLLTTKESLSYDLKDLA